MIIKRVRKIPKRSDLRNTPAGILRINMDRHGYTNTMLAKKTGRSDAHISNILNGKSRITPAFAVDLEMAFPYLAAEFWIILEVKQQLKQVRMGLPADIA